LNALPTSTAIRYKTIAQKLGINPLGKNGQTLKPTGKAYKDFVVNSVMSKYEEKRKQIASSSAVKNAILSKKTGVKKYTSGEVNRKIKAPKINKNANVAPHLIKKVQIEGINKFAKYMIFLEGVNNIEELYEQIVEQTENNPDADIYISLIYENQETGKPRFIAIGSDYLKYFHTFKARVDAITTGKLEGSDAINPNEDVLILNQFVISTYSITGNGSSESMLFETENIESKRGLCAYECLKKCGYDFKGDRKELALFNKLSEVILKEKLPISIIANGFTTRKNHKELLKEKPEVEIFTKNKLGNECLNLCGLLVEEDINMIYLLDNRSKTTTDGEEIAFGKYTIIYDETNSHYDIIPNNTPVMKKEVYLSYSCKVLMNGKIIFSPKQLNINTQNKNKSCLYYVFFDYETIIDFEISSCMKPYSLSILVLNDEELVEMERLDLITGGKDADKAEEAKLEIDAIRAKKCKTFLGYDCSKLFINWILENQINKNFMFVGFNNSNFDNFLLLDGLLRNQMEDYSVEYSVSNVFYNGSQLLNFVLNGRHNTFDIHKHLTGSLKKNCEDFKINSCAKKEFDHHKAQLLYLEDKLLDYITDNDELKTYNEYDVMATAVLFQKYRNALDSIPATKPYAEKIASVKTIGSLIYKVFNDSKNKKGYNLPKLEFKEYEDLQKSKIAGRVELFNGVQKVCERLVSTDVCSLYPYVMSVLDCYYPTGKETQKVSEYKGDNVIGFYYCDIDQSNLKEKNLPNIYAFKTEIENNWAYEGVLENYLISNVMIGLLRKHGCKVVVKNGFIFPDKRKSCEMFDFLLDFMKAKNEQDTFKKVKDTQYNPALRETLKLLMNALSGKVIEGLHTEKTIDVNNSYEYLQVKDKAKSINFINAIGGKLFLTYEVEAEDICSREQRPIYLGVLIYDYAKRYMYEHSYSKVGKSRLLYTDTDASKFRYKHFLKWKKWIDDNNVQVPHHKEVEDIDPRYKDHKIYEAGSKVFGSFEDELEDMVGENYTFYCLEKKSWLYDVDGHAKFRFKGINGNAQLLTLGEEFIGAKQINHKPKDNKEAYTETKYFITPDSEEEVYLHYNNNKQNGIENGNEVKFFEQIYTTGEAYVLTNSFRKIVKNSARNVEEGDTDKYNNLMNKIQVNFMMKHINLKY
jgi:hypothetical protein